MAKQSESQSFMDLFAKFGRDLKMPNVDVDAILDHHRKNLEALEESAKASAAGMSSLANRQREMVEEAMREITDMAQNYSAPGDTKEMVAKQAAFARRSFETAVKNTSEVADLAKKSGSESVEILRKRIKEATEEVRKGYDKTK